MNRRRFLHQTAATTLLTTAAGSVRLAVGQEKPNERLTVGVIGVGKQAKYLTARTMRFPQTQVVAVCDVVRERRDAAAQQANEFYAKSTGKADYDAVAKFEDFRELIARQDIDAVIIATPDHWHSIPTIAAAKAKKDIYLEKPVSHTIREGRAMVKAVQENQVVFQTGSMQRSEFDGKFRIASELVRNGRIGQVKTVHIGIGDPSYPCDLPEQAVPDGTNWDLWLGPAPWRGYNEILCPKGVHDHFPAWRHYREYAGGGVADFGAHHYDIAQWGLGTDDTGPVKILPPSDEKAKRGLKLIYANGIEMFHGAIGGTTWVGTEGVVSVDRGRLETIPSDLRTKKPLGEGDVKLENVGGQAGTSHIGNWLARIADRGKCICHEEVGHRSATLCHLTNIGYRLRRELRWDPAKEEFVDDAEANKLLHYDMRGEWKIDF